MPQVLTCGDRGHSCRERFNRFITRKGAEFEIVVSSLSRLKLDQFTSFASVHATRGPVGARFDPDDVVPFAEHPPDEMAWKLRAVKDLVRPDPKGAINDRHRRVAVRFAQ